MASISSGPRHAKVLVMDSCDVVVDIAPQCDCNRYFLGHINISTAARFHAIWSTILKDIVFQVEQILIH